MSVHIYPTPEALSSAAADHIAASLGGRNRTTTLGLAGGGTPAATYLELAKRRVDWANTVMWLGDERWVEPDHAESNTRMARETLVDLVAGQLIAPKAGQGDPTAVAADYFAELAKVFFDGRPDVVLLGIGDDGHTASLFPDTDALDDPSTSYLANWVASKDTWRLTASMPLLWSAREIVFLVQGEGKANVLRQILDDADPYPSQRVAAGASQVRWLIDEAAASRLRTIPR